MSSRSVYVLDNNVLRTACEKYYRFSFCPGFWDLLLHAAKERLVFSVDRIKKELLEAEAED